MYNLLMRIYTKLTTIETFKVLLPKRHTKAMNTRK